MSNYEQARERMVREQLEARGVRDAAVLAAMRAVPRHLFVPEDLREEAYEDHPLPIGKGQTISQPYIVGRMSELLELTGHERVLEVGAGCGYQSAILSMLAQEVCAVELEKALVARAKKSLAALSISNVCLIEGNGYAAWPGGGRFDAILCACAPGEMPVAFTTQLSPGGRIVLPVGPTAGVQDLQCWRKDNEGNLSCRSAGGVRFVPMRGRHSLS